MPRLLVLVWDHMKETSPHLMESLCSLAWKHRKQINRESCQMSHCHAHGGKELLNSEGRKHKFEAQVVGSFWLLIVISQWCKKNIHLLFDNSVGQMSTVTQQDCFLWGIAGHSMKSFLWVYKSESVTLMCVLIVSCILNTYYPVIFLTVL
jgi:hypothetical protein